MDVWARRREIVRDIYRLLRGEFCGVERRGGTKGRTEVDNLRAPPPPRADLAAAAGSYCTATHYLRQQTNQPTPDKFLYEYYISDLDQIRRSKTRVRAAASLQRWSMMACLCAACLRVMCLWNGRDSDSSDTR